MSTKTTDRLIHLPAGLKTCRTTSGKRTQQLCRRTPFLTHPRAETIQAGIFPASRGGEVQEMAAVRPDDGAHDDQGRQDKRYPCCCERDDASQAQQVYTWPRVEHRKADTGDRAVYQQAARGARTKWGMGRRERGKGRFKRLQNIVQIFDTKIWKPQESFQTACVELSKKIRRCVEVRSAPSSTTRV